ncbi:sugar ABC transporter permease [Cellulosilyticum sp. ST5]|uniref:carbohydrate ABC transporter permease n=1 Tax=unclassified Cellulosilyticum TaxID=2643091 RepID=UPI000F8C6D51|nr:sugar ABC transporter permease [Cellulosilyticum sp. WCF-2]QEH67003.1 sugar ABC transporter permease [Cellulosilyticum sp. WCF-2]
MKRSKVGFWLFLAPCLLAFLTVVFIPMLGGFYYSFTDWDGMASSVNFVGLDNFVRLFTEEKQFWISFKFTALFTLASVILINIVGFALALLVTKRFKGANLLRSIFFMPNLIGGLLLGFAWQFIFTKVFPATGIPFLQNWLTNKETGFMALLIVMVWQMGGYMMIIYVAALQGIPDTVLEAAELDGAKGLTKLRTIIMPMVSQAFTVGLFLMLSNSFKLFDQNLALTGGGPNRSTEMLALNIYQTAFSGNEMGYAQAKALVFLVTIAIISIIQLTISKRAEIEA